MTELNDEMLVAYVDGELSPKDAAQVEMALQTDQQVREAVQIFRDTADWSRRAFDDVLREPVPERLLHAATGQPDAAGTNRAEPPHDGRSAKRGIQNRRAGLAMAASIALAIGVGGGFGLSQWSVQGEAGPAGIALIGAVDSGGALHGALESGASGTLTEIGNGGDVMPLTTFVDHGGRYCRKFLTTLASDSGSSAAFGIACRQPLGTWLVEAVGAAPIPGQGASDRFVTATGLEEDVLQVVIGAMSDTGPIALDDEAALLATGWK